MENTNIFDKTVEMLIEDANSLQRKFTKLQENNDFRGAIDCMRLLKDCLALIKEYDWKFDYSEYETDGKKQIAIWEQNHCGEIKNHKTWDVKPHAEYNSKTWCDMFRSKIEAIESYTYQHGDKHRGTGKSFSIAKLCNDYNGVVVSSRKAGFSGVRNNCDLYGFDIKFIEYKYFDSDNYKGKIVFFDEGSGLTHDMIEVIRENNIVVGFM